MSASPHKRIKRWGNRSCGAVAVPLTSRAQAGVFEHKRPTLERYTAEFLLWNFGLGPALPRHV